MKKLTLLSLAAATVLFTACDQKTKDAGSSTSSEVTKVVKSDTTAKNASANKKTEDVAKIEDVVKKEAKKMADAAAAKVKAAATKATTKVIDVAAAIKAREAASTEKVEKVPASGSDIGKVTFAKCAGCHGANGKISALGKSAIIAGQSVSDLVTALKAYKAGTRNVSGMGKLMKVQVGSMDDATMNAVAKYISGL